MKHVEDPQNELPLSREARQIEIPIEIIRAAKHGGRAIDLACTAADLDPKEVYMPLGIDAGTWSKILAGKATFPDNKIRDLCDLLRNRIYVEWVAYQAGCTAVLIKSEAERIADEAIARAQRAEHEIVILRDILKAGKS